MAGRAGSETDGKKEIPARVRRYSSRGILPPQLFTAQYFEAAKSSIAPLPMGALWGSEDEGEWGTLRRNGSDAAH